MKNFKVAIIVDHPDRDLDGLILLSYFLIKKNCEVSLVPMYYHTYEIPFVNPDLILFNNIGDHNIEYIKSYKSNGYSIAILNSEEGLRSFKFAADHPLKMAKLFKKKKYFKYVDLYFCWGSYVANFMKKHSGLIKKKIIVSGCPRYDLCSTKFRNKIFKEKILFNVLINTNFQATNPFHKNTSSEKKTFSIYGMDKKYIEKLFKSLTDTFKSYLDLLDNLFIHFKNKKFLLRVHPFENENIYNSLFKKYSNVTIDRKGSIFKSIIKSELVMHLNCGSSIDALFLKKIPISFEFLNNDIIKQNSPLPSKVSLRANNIKELYKFIINSKKIKFNFNKRKKKISKWFMTNSKNEYSSQKLAFFLHEFLLKNKFYVKKNNLFLLFKSGQSSYFIKNIVYRFFYIFFGPFFLKIIENLRSSTKLKNFNKNYVYLFLQKLTPKKEHDKINVSYFRHLINKTNLRSVRVYLKNK